MRKTNFGGMLLAFGLIMGLYVLWLVLPFRRTSDTLPVDEKDCFVALCGAVGALLVRAWRGYSPFDPGDGDLG